MDWIYIDWYIILLPVAFIHGWFVGRKHGIKIGSAGMFDHLFNLGKPVYGKKNTRTVEVSLDE